MVSVKEVTMFYERLLIFHLYVLKIVRTDIIHVVVLVLKLKILIDLNFEFIIVQKYK